MESPESTRELRLVLFRRLRFYRKAALTVLWGGLNADFRFSVADCRLSIEMPQIPRGVFHSTIKTQQPTILPGIFRTFWGEDRAMLAYVHRCKNNAITLQYCTYILVTISHFETENRRLCANRRTKSPRWIPGMPIAEPQRARRATLATRLTLPTRTLVIVR
jgi:hypothetical protein